MAKILVTGGCGYIGSHTIVDLIQNGFDVISADNNARSYPTQLDGVAAITGIKVKNYKVDLCDKQATESIFLENPDIDGIIHFAAYKTVPESVKNPLLYFNNNIGSLLSVLDCVEEYGVSSFVFSSSCSVYGNATDLPVTEDTPFEEAECAYARTKQMGEQIIRDFCASRAKHKAILLRYFNPVGAHTSIQIGETPFMPPDNLVPIITQTAIGIREQMTVFGSDYDTRDGSCIRDYIHVMDIAAAHTRALQCLQNEGIEGNLEILNLGTGKGVTVLEAIEAFEKVSGQKLNYKLGDRRPGDVVAIYANNEKARNLLGWEAATSLDTMMSTAWKWEQKLAATTVG